MNGRLWRTGAATVPAMATSTAAPLPAFELIARYSGGALIPFDGNSPNQLRDLLGAVAAYIAGGVEALTDQRSEIVRLLTHGGRS